MSLHYCNGCHRLTERVDCFLSEYQRIDLCPCTSCIVKVNCTDPCDERTEIVRILSDHIGTKSTKDILLKKRRIRGCQR